MTARPAELLVRVDPESADDGLALLRESFRVTQVASPRLAVVAQTEASHEAQLRRTPGVEDVAGAEVTPEFRKGLSPAEELFVAAWEQRMREADGKKRSGEGLQWDAPGFSPPDPPPSDR